MENVQTDTSASSNTRTLGIALIALGTAFLLSRLIPGFSSVLWILAFAGGGFGFATLYNRNDRRWWALALAYIFFFVAGAILVGMTFLPGEFLGAYFMFGFAGPFLWLYIQNRDHWFWLIPGGIFAAIGALLLLIGLGPVLPLLLILAGAVLVVREVNKNKNKNGIEVPARPLTGPEADI